MSKLPRLSSRKLLRILNHSGFKIHHATGSHIHLYHEARPHLRVTVPANENVLAPKTLKSILVQAELTIEDLLD